ncbi:oxidoreductase [Aphelenchoides avenae]|nr:oxidoreductase [Aphelenchus avenae]
MSTEHGGPRVKLNTGYEMPLVGFGTYKVTGQDTMDTAVDAALSSGYRHFDTAKLYVNEPELGTSLEKLLPKYNLARKDIFLTTKFCPPEDGDAEKVISYVKESLTNLKTDYIDLVLLHYPKSDKRENDDPANAGNRRDAWVALERLKKEGLIHSIGVSNYELRHLEEMPTYSTTVPAVNQVEYHPHFRRAYIKNYCDQHGIFFQAFSSLARHHPDVIGDPVVNDLATKYKTTAQQVLLSFATTQKVGIVPKSTNPERIRENIKCLQLVLSDEDIARLNSIDKDQHYIRCTPWLVK